MNFGSQDDFSFFLSRFFGVRKSSTCCLLHDGWKIFNLIYTLRFKTKICVDSKSPWAHRIVAKYSFDIDWKYTLILWLDTHIYFYQWVSSAKIFHNFNVYILSANWLKQRTATDRAAMPIYESSMKNKLSSFAFWMGSDGDGVVVAAAATSQCHVQNRFLQECNSEFIWITFHISLAVAAVAAADLWQLLKRIVHMCVLFASFFVVRLHWLCLPCLFL